MVIAFGATLFGQLGPRAPKAPVVRVEAFSSTERNGQEVSMDLEGSGVRR
ncbi:ABC transporter permease [Streptomyces narbonensis]